MKPEHIMTTAKPRTIHSIQILRAVAAMLVVLVIAEMRCLPFGNPLL